MGVAACTGLGNPERCLLDNKWSSNENLNNILKNMFEEAMTLYFKDVTGFDFQIIESENETSISFGFEPAYQFERLRIVKINTNKANSYLQQGKAFGAYGSGIRSTTKRYDQYKRQSKFIKFIDKWHKELSKVV
jgi:hypothetical protein